MGLIAALRKQGLSVQPYKVGPDYIDSAYHSALAGRTCINLDTWMTPDNFVRETFHRHASGADIAVVEGVMGLFDGKDGRGSSAHIAKLLGLPVVLVIDAGMAAQSAAALLYGFETFDPELNVSGALFNNIAGSGHWDCITEAADKRCRARLFGYLRKNSNLRLPERQLGLVSAHERGLSEAFIEQLTDAVEETIDLNALLEHLPSFEPDTLPERKTAQPCGRLGVARDEAFCFYYQDNLDLLKQAGIELIEFSPLHDRTLPDVAALYFGGGFPEEFTGKLSQNKAMLEAIRSFHGKILAECGGLIYLCREFTGLDGKTVKLAGRINGRIGMTDTLQACGYREVEFNCDTILGPQGTVLRGHEFHWSKWIDCPENFGALNSAGRKWGVADKNIFASYFHIHFGSNPAAVEFFRKELSA